MKEKSEIKKEKRDDKIKLPRSNSLDKISGILTSSITYDDPPSEKVPASKSDKKEIIISDKSEKDKKEIIVSDKSDKKEITISDKSRKDTHEKDKVEKDNPLKREDKIRPRRERDDIDALITPRAHRRTTSNTSPKKDRRNSKDIKNYEIKAVFY